MTNKALVVDDNFYNRDLARLALEQAGFVVDEAENGVEALQYLETELFDLLILDIEMPELDGIGVIREIKRTSQHNHMKIIIITAHSFLAGSINEMADFVMHKPIDINLFVTFLNRLKVSTA